MNPEQSPPPRDADDEIPALIEVLHETDQRLEEVTAGQVDAVADRDGRAFLLRRAQDGLRDSVAAKQGAILDALPAHVALVDARGLIVAVNETWRRFGCALVAHGPGHGLGLNYLEICGGARGDDSFEAHQVAEGLRSVLAGDEKVFTIEYACHSPAEQRWFLMTATPLADDRPNGAVVMHLDVTAERQTAESLQAAELKFRQMAENIRDVFWLTDPAKNRILYISPAYEEIWGRSCESLYASPRDWIDAIHLEDRERVLRAAKTRQADGTYIEEYRIVRTDGAIRWIRDRAFPVFGDDGGVYRIAGLAEDITERRRAESALRESEAQLKGILESTADGILAVDGDGKVIRANRRFAELWRIPESLLDTGDDLALLEFVRGQLKDAGPFVKKVHSLYASVAEDVDELNFKDGRIFERSSFPLLLDGAILGRVWSFRDVTERKKAEGRILHLNRVHALLSGISSAIVRIHDRQLLFEEACRIAVEDGNFGMAWIGQLDAATLDITPVAWAGQGAEIYAGAKSTARSDTPAGQGAVGRAIRERRPVFSNDILAEPGVGGRRRAGAAARGFRSLIALPLMVKDEVIGNFSLFARELNFFTAEEVKLLGALADDISFAIENIQRGERLSYLAYYDELTGLANRRLFLDRLAQYLRSAAAGGHELAVFLINLERFKNINDSLGRPAGDSLLRQVAQWLTGRLGDANLLARVGADQFAVVLPEIQQEGNVARLLEKGMEAFLDHPFRLNDSVFRIAFKAGVAQFPDDGADPDTLLRNAEAALKKARAGGDRYLFYTQKMTERVAGALTLENQLRQALDKGEFVLHYQPKVSLASGEITGAEALIRWNDPRTGLVPPGRFIPILEETGLIYEVGRWALHQAIEDYLRWLAAGLPAVRIAVNVSPLQLRNRGFVGEIEQAIGAGAAAGLELEITESLIMENVEHNIASLRAIRALGVCIAIDDFGTGYSSLSYLSKLPVDTLKIDRSFVANMGAEASGVALVSAIVKLAHALDLKVVAEGVETEEQSGRLRLLGCDEMQGYLFSKAVPSDIFEAKFLGHPSPGEQCP